MQLRCPPDVKEDWSGRSWNMEVQFGTLTLELEKVQNRAARFVTGNYLFETGSMTGTLGQLKWDSLKKMRNGSRLILLYKGLGVAPEYLQMTLSQRKDVVEINTL